jgi:hypothetical protein
VEAHLEQLAGLPRYWLDLVGNVQISSLAPSSGRTVVRED